MTFDTTSYGDAGMPDSSDDDIPAAPLSMLVGDLRGRVRLHETRMDRHETWVGEKFNVIDKKVDGLDTKMDQILEMLAGQAGGRAVWKFLTQPAFLIMSFILSIGGALLLHLLKVN